MKKLIIGLVLMKLTLLSLFWMFSFSAYKTVGLADFGHTPTPTPTATPVNDTINRETSDPYKGDLSVFDKEGRAENLQVERVMDVLQIAEAKSVADIGAGSGWFTVFAAKRVGAKGKVFAVDINEDSINFINERKLKENLLNIQTVLGKEDDPLLPKKSVDAVLLLKTYHEIAQPIRLMKNLRSSLRKNALVGIIDRNGGGGNHGVDKATVIEELQRAGFVLKEEHDFVKGDRMDYFLVFQTDKNQK